MNFLFIEEIELAKALDDVTKGKYEKLPLKTGEFEQPFLAYNIMIEELSYPFLFSYLWCRTPSHKFQDLFISR
ncbi:hypothetical protein [Halalkalibacter akibai]|uniref:Uncharacterized protein n=1 Tax=Halalkalibacter akibai (strain ATCC 43226 / DSM 21942 / CIP 109018 / JCM 9157 / 1139) TaxID=1236973 RepID=W4QRP2_HALA3|nr:hypothetical protein [Halalkalibacter akibai]GAE34766.1 hypothetical protein JCM9157_1844 [Halalkalibacter akibai JCM 9157]